MHSLPPPPRQTSVSTIAFAANSSYVSAALDRQRHPKLTAALKLVIEKSLASLPRRKTDNAIIIQSQDNDVGKAKVFKLNANPSDPILLERNGSHERQYRFICPRCSLPIGYQTAPPPVKSVPYLYILPGALSQAQGQVPPDAFDGENEL
ncbi:hypothetical protein CC2G_010425 [Coprinopsis cinerea AmutBmut pab1-1]|nr:hypothetical protein CC2G_010425 [Coprinopsis cinerea AmutBmut pab1-1]